MIPFIKPPKIDLDIFFDYFSKTTESGQYSNFGPNEQSLTKKLSNLCKSKILMAGNATLILDGFHKILSRYGTASLPTWTFPATNLGCPVTHRHYAPTFDFFTDAYGYADHSKSVDDFYALTVAPFGNIPKKYERPKNKCWIVDNAAGATPDMANVRWWLDKGADAVIVSLHATKGLSACEGGFAAFNDTEYGNFLYNKYKAFMNFGFVKIDPWHRQIQEEGGSNHKMSELNAAYCLSSMETFAKEYSRRKKIADKYSKFCEKKSIPYIYSTQAFWIESSIDNVDLQKIAAEEGLDMRPYYTPLVDGNMIDDPVGKRMAQKGVCLPTWPMNDDVANKCIEILDICFRKEESSGA